MNRSLSRRSVLTAGATAAAAMTRTTRAQNGANDKLTVALVGCGGQGRYDTRSILEVGGNGTVLAAICDVDQQRLDDTTGEMTQKFGQTPEQYKDYRKLLDRKDIDIVVVGTPDHWHAAVEILACQTGKDVYVEKPCSHTIHEGKQMVKAARKHKRIVQVGQQQRSDDHFKEAMAYLHNGSPLGKITRTFTMNYGNETPNGIGMGKDERPSQVSEQDYDMWLGAAPKRPFNSNRFHYLWRWFYDYAGGMICDWNVHIQDIVQWGMQASAPKSVVASGGKVALNDNRETPDMMDVVYEYDGFTQVYTMSKVYEKGRYPDGYGTEFFGTDGSMFSNRSGWEVTPQMKHKSVDDPDKPGEKKSIQVPRTEAIKKPGKDSVPPHAQNFLDCVRSRKAEDLHCDILVGHQIATACHLGNIALRLGKKIWWDAEREIITHQDGTPDAAANAWLTKEYRKGYELPEV